MFFGRFIIHATDEKVNRVYKADRNRGGAGQTGVCTEGGGAHKSSLWVNNVKN